MRHRIIASILIALGLTAPAAGFGFETSLSGEFTTGAAIAGSADFAWTQLYAENRLQLDAAAGDAWITAELYIESSPLEAVPFLIRPGEMYLDWAHESRSSIIGRQIITWGRMDALSILNLISPPDTERMFTGRGPATPLPILAVQWNRDIPNGMLELLYIPLSPYPNGRALNPHNGIASGTLDFSLDEGEAGIRLRWFLPHADAALSLFSGRDRAPTVARPDADTGLPAIRHHRLNMIGIDAAVPVGATVLRFESGLFHNRKFTPSELGNDPVRAIQLQGATGIDWLPGDWRFIAEARGGILLQPEGTPADGTQQIDYGAELARSFRQGEIELSLQAMYQQHQDNLYLHAGTTWQTPAGPRVEIGAEYLQGTKGLFALREDGLTPYLRLRFEY